MTTTTGRRFDPFVAFLVLACVGLAVVAFLLARENSSLKTRLNEINRSAVQPAPGDPSRINL